MVGKKRYKTPRLRRREKLAKVTAQQTPVTDGRVLVA